MNIVFIYLFYVKDNYVKEKKTKYSIHIVGICV